MRKGRLAVLLPGILLAGAPPAWGATFVFINNDSANFGLNDPTPVQAVGGNAGTTIGEQRQLALDEAGRIWGQFLYSDVPIRVNVNFEELGSSSTGFTLAYAGAEDYESDFTNAPLPNTYYPVALANSLAGKDLQPSRADVSITINASLDSQSELGNWYYGFDNNAGRSEVDFIDVVTHEIAHGLGFSTTIDKQTGRFADNTPDIYAVHLRDTSIGLNFTQMSRRQRTSAMVNEPYLVWNGISTTAATPHILTPDKVTLTVSSPSSVSGNYVVSPASYGPGVPSTGITGQLVLVNDGVSPTADTCSEIINVAAIEGNIAFIDRGDCNFDDKTYRAQLAGAIAVVFANNVAGRPIFPGGDEIIDGNPVSITIPTVAISLEDAELIKTAGSGVRITLGPSEGAFSSLTEGYLQLHAPPDLVSGSSVSHWTTFANPNLLMEPNAESDLRDDLDLTLTLMKDIGWRVLEIPYPHLTVGVWQDENFSNPADALLTSNPDQDSLSNLEEYVFGGDPFTPDNERLPIFHLDDGQRRFSYHRSKIITDATIIYEISSDLNNWTEAQAGIDISEETTTPLNTQTETVSINLLGNAPQTFIRLRLELDGE